MRKLILIILLSSLVFAQDKYFTFEKGLQIGSTVLFSFSGGYADGQYWLKENGNLSSEEMIRVNKSAHRWAIVRDVSGIAVGGTIALTSESYKMFDSWNSFGRTAIKGLFSTLFMGAIRYNIYDWAVYTGMGLDKPFYWQSDWSKNGNNGVLADQIGRWYVKVGALIITFLLDYFSNDIIEIVGL